LDRSIFSFTLIHTKLQPYGKSSAYRADGERATLFLQVFLWESADET
jgi:hypothetical protein